MKPQYKCKCNSYVVEILEEERRLLPYLDYFQLVLQYYYKATGYTSVRIVSANEYIHPDLYNRIYIDDYREDMRTVYREWTAWEA